MGTKVQYKSFFPGFHPSRDLNMDMISNWCCNYDDKGHDKLLSNDASALRPFNIYSCNDKEVLRRTMLEHEATFRKQVYELHRLYKVQRDLMVGFDKQQLDRSSVMDGTTEEKMVRKKGFSLNSHTLEESTSGSENCKPDITFMDLNKPPQDFWDGKLSNTDPQKMDGAEIEDAEAKTTLSLSPEKEIIAAWKTTSTSNFLQEHQLKVKQHVPHPSTDPGPSGNASSLSTILPCNKFSMRLEPQVRIQEGHKAHLNRINIVDSVYVHEPSHYVKFHAMSADVAKPSYSEFSTSPHTYPCTIFDRASRTNVPIEPIPTCGDPGAIRMNHILDIVPQIPCYNGIGYVGQSSEDLVMIGTLGRPESSLRYNNLLAKTYREVKKHGKAVESVDLNTANDVHEYHKIRGAQTQLAIPKQCEVPLAVGYSNNTNRLVPSSFCLDPYSLPSVPAIGQGVKIKDCLNSVSRGLPDNATTEPARLSDIDLNCAVMPVEEGDRTVPYLPGVFSEVPNVAKCSIHGEEAGGNSKETESAYSHDLKAAAETIVFLSAVPCSAQGVKSCNALCSSLQWLAEIVISAANSEDVLDQIDDGGLFEVPSDDNLCNYKSMAVNLGEVKENRDNFPETPLLARPQRGLPSKHQQQGNFQKNILLGLASLSKHEVTEDLQSLQGPRKESGKLLRKAAQNSRCNYSSRGKGRQKPRCSPAPATDNHFAKVDSAGSSEVEICGRNILAWGRKTRRCQRMRSKS